MKTKIVTDIIQIGNKPEHTLSLVYEGLLYDISVRIYFVPNDEKLYILVAPEDKNTLKSTLKSAVDAEDEILSLLADDFEDVPQKVYTSEKKDVWVNDVAVMVSYR